MRKPFLPLIYKITIAVASATLSLWLSGFLLFAANALSTLPQGSKADVAIVLTGGTGRIEEGLTLIAKDEAKAMLITGVHPDVRLQHLIDRWPGDTRTKNKLAQHCCIYIDYKAMSTEENASETRAWLERNGGAAGVHIRLVTSDYHMPRAMLLFKRALPGAQISAWPVPSTNRTSLVFWRMMLTEYTKTLLTWIA